MITEQVELIFSYTKQINCVGEYDYLIVELKRPRQKINPAVIQQIESYATAVARDEQFAGANINWCFVAVSNELDDYARRKANQRDKPKGHVYDAAELNIKIDAKEWAKIINDARVRLSSVNEQLAYQADSDSAKTYLNKAHAKYIPNPESATE